MAVHADAPVRPRPSSPVGPITTLLAYLLLANGRPISTERLGRRVYPDADDPAVTAARELARLRRTTDIPIGVRRTGYFLRGLPPDDLLDVVLDEVHRIRRAYPESRWVSVGAWLQSG